MEEPVDAVSVGTGAVRSAKYTGDKPHEFSARFDLIFKNREGLEAIARAYGEGILKYGRDNWLKGFQESVLIQHAIAHLIAYEAGDTSEDHLGHILWNFFTLAHTKKHRPDLCDVTGPDPGPNRAEYNAIMEEKAKFADAVEEFTGHPVIQNALRKFGADAGEKLHKATDGELHTATP